jgi:hypothetical protein
MKIEVSSTSSQTGVTISPLGAHDRGHDCAQNSVRPRRQATSLALPRALQELFNAFDAFNGNPGGLRLKSARMWLAASPPDWKEVEAVNQYAEAMKAVARLLVPIQAAGY